MGGSLDHYTVVMRDEREEHLNFKFPSYYAACTVQVDTAALESVHTVNMEYTT